MVKRGDIYFAVLSPVVGSEQGGTRPVLVIQNNLGNHFSPTVIVAAITAKMAKPKLPTHIGIKATGTSARCVAQCSKRYEKSCFLHFGIRQKSSSQ